VLEDIELFENQVRQIGETLHATTHYIRWDQLPEEHKFQRLAPTAGNGSTPYA